MHLLPPTPDITYLLGTQLGDTVYLLQIIEKRYMTTCKSPHPLNRLVTLWTCCQAVTHMRDDVLAPMWQCGSSVRVLRLEVLQGSRLLCQRHLSHSFAAPDVCTGPRDLLSLLSMPLYLALDSLRTALA